MNKKIKKYFEELGLKIEGNCAHGSIKGYEVSANVVMLDTISPVKLHVAFHASDETKIAIANDLKELKLKYFSYDLDVYGITLGFNDPLTVGKLLNRMPEMLNSIFGVFNKHEAKGLGYCPVCGEELAPEAKKYRIEWAQITIDDKCIGDLNQVIEAENKEFIEAPNNYLKGTIGALLGALVGAVAFVILFLLGFVSAITSFVAILLGTLLYKKFGGKQNAVMVVIVSITSIVSMLLTLWGLYVVAAQVLVYEFGFTSTGFQAFIDMMTIPDFSSEFVTNLVMTLFFTLLGVGYQIYQLGKSVKRQGTIK
jgi:hypothetical protein